MGNNPSIYEPEIREEFDARRKERGLDYLVRRFPTLTHCQISCFLIANLVAEDYKLRFEFVVVILTVYARFWMNYFASKTLCNENIR